MEPAFPAGWPEDLAPVRLAAAAVVAAVASSAAAVVAGVLTAAVAIWKDKA